MNQRSDFDVASRPGGGRGRGVSKFNSPKRGRSLSIGSPTLHRDTESRDGVLPTGIAPADVFLLSRLNDTTSYFFTWFCKKHRIRIGPTRELGRKEEIQTRCPICLDACTKSIELQCGHSFCRSCLIQSAANNMTSCALCRREQEIDPELLRARFDEQRMLNLAQRLAIPPPVRSRASTPGTSMSGVGAREGKEGRLRLRGTSTSEREMLFGPWGDVGAMSSDDLRRRWNCGAQAATVTVGAASSSDLRSSWRELQYTSRSSICVHSEREHAGAYPQVSHGAVSASCSGDADACMSDVGDVGSHSAASPVSPCAGETTLASLSFRWCTMPRILPGNNSDHASPSGLTTGSEHLTPFGRGDIGGLDSASLRKRWQDVAGDTAVGVGDVDVSKLAGRLALAAGCSTFSKPSTPFATGDVGGLDSASLRKRWQDAAGDDDMGVGDLEVSELSGRLTVTADFPTCSELSTPFGRGDIGGLDSASLLKRWQEAAGDNDMGVGDLEVSELAGRLASAADCFTFSKPSTPFGRGNVGGLDSACLRKRWQDAAGDDDMGVGDLEVSELADRLTVTADFSTCSEPSTPFGRGDIGGLDSASLLKRWQGALGVRDVGDLEVSEYADRLAVTADFSTRSKHSMPFGKGDVGGLDAAFLLKCWQDTAGYSDVVVGDLDVSELAGRLTVTADFPTCSEPSTPFGRGGVGGLDSACLRKRWQEAAGDSDVEVGDLEVSELAGRLALAAHCSMCSELVTPFGRGDIGGLDSASLRKRWQDTAGYSDVVVGDLDVSALARRLTVATGRQGVGDMPIANLGQRWKTSCSEELEAELKDVGSHVNSNMLDREVGSCCTRGKAADPGRTASPLFLDEQGVGAGSSGAVGGPAPVG